MQLVIVEFPAKAKTIEKYLGTDYKVLASYGHVRDLPPKDGSVRPGRGLRDGLGDSIGDKVEPASKEIADAAKKADRLILATDPDREGEAISLARAGAARPSARRCPRPRSSGSPSTPSPRTR